MLEARDRLGGRIWTDDSLGAPVDLGGSWVHGVDGNPLALWCGKLGIELIESRGDRLLIDRRARRRTTRDGAAPPRRPGRAAFKTAIAWASWKSKAMTLISRARARSRSRKRSIRCCTRSWLPEIDRLVIATFVEGSEGVQGAPYDRIAAEEWFPTEAARAQRPAAAAASSR